MERDNKERLVVDGGINIYLKRTGLKSRGHTDLTQNRDKWQAVVNALMNIQVLGKARNLNQLRLRYFET